jgi:hypothetical protein
MLPRVTHVARHRLLRLLGEGSAAQVYEVLTPEGERRALKLSRPGLSMLDAHQGRLAQEGEAVAMIEHVNVVRFYDAGVEGGRVWLLLELVDGPDLRSLARSLGGALPLLRALRIVRQASEGVAAAHALGILHRDLRPENLLVAEGDLVKVADFGSAKLAGWGVKTTHEQARCSSLYMAPEYMQRRVAAPASDVYAMGLVLYEAVTGAHPIAPSAAPAIEICRRQLSYDPPPLASLGRGLPGDLSALLERALSKDPARRPSMRGFADGLAEALWRLHAPQRAVARGALPSKRDPALARTEPVMAAFAPPASSFAAVSPPALPAEVAPEDACDRGALLPPAPVGEHGPASIVGGQDPRSWGAPTLRSPGSPLPSPSGEWESHPVAAGRHGSTTSPVVQVASRSSGVGRGKGSALAWVVALGVVVMVSALLFGVRWVMFDAMEPAPAGRASGVAVLAPPGAQSAAASSAAASGSASAPGATGRPARR